MCVHAFIQGPFLTQRVWSSSCVLLVNPAVWRDAKRQRTFLCLLTPQDCLTVGAAMGKEEEAERVVESLRGRVDAVLAFVASQPPLARPAVGWMEWTEPIFVS